MLQPTPAPAVPFAERLRSGARPRALALGLTLLIEGLLLILLLSFSGVKPPEAEEEEEAITVANLEPNQVAEELPEPGRPDPAQRAEEQALPLPLPLPRPPAEHPPPAPSSEPLLPQPAAQSPVRTAPAILPTPYTLPPSSELAGTAPRPAPSTGRVYGPPDTGGSSALRDTEQVGTAPNGEPLYAAAWHRKPKPSDLRAYLSTARGPGWGLIACRTAPNYRVQDCVPLDEHPAGSQINRAIIAAAWEFEVRPPRRGGRLLVGSWVRIRIDYVIERR